MVRNENSYFRVLLLIVMSISLLTPHTVLAQTNTEEKKVDYYYEGQDEAKIDYSGDGAMYGGFASVFLGPITWGLGNLIVEGKSVDVPRRYTTDLESNQRRDFKDGYIDYVKKERKSKFIKGTAVATLTIVVIIAILLDDAKVAY